MHVLNAADLPPTRSGVDCGRVSLDCRPAFCSTV